MNSSGERVGGASHVGVSVASSSSGAIHSGTLGYTRTGRVLVRFIALVGIHAKANDDEGTANMYCGIDVTLACSCVFRSTPGKTKQQVVVVVVVRGQHGWAVQES